MVPESHKNTATQSDTLSSEGSVLSIFRNRPILFAIYAIIFLGNVFLYAIMVFLPKIFVELGLSNPFYIGLTITTMGIASAATSLLYSRVRAKLSYRAIAVLITFLWAVALFMMSQAFSVWFVWLSIVICGIGMGIMMPAIPIWAGEQVSASYRGRITSYLGTFGFVGQFLSPIFLSPIATSLGLSWVFIVSGGVSVLIMIAFSLSLRR
jgi:MFS family permease